MQLTMYQTAIPPVIRMLGNLSAILDKAMAHCEARKIDPSVLMHYRLAADMLPFPRQIQIMSDTAKGMASRLAGVEAPSFPDTESTMGELKERIAKTIDYLKSFSEAQINGSEDKEIVLKFPSIELKFKGSDYLLGFVLPNFYFHATMAYGLLRHAGVELGKRDFLGGA
jgi:hypothetical protein